MAVPFTDLVVLVPGFMGSELTQRGRPVWAASAGAALEAVRTFGRSVLDLTLPDGLGDDAPGDDDPGGAVVATGLFPDIHVIPGLWTANLGYSAITRSLVDTLGLTPVVPDGPPGNFLAFAYDWRLSVRHNGRRLARTLDAVVERWRGQGGAYAAARVSIVAHSMGGLVARWALDREGAAGYTRRLVTLATPHRGSMVALDRLVNGIGIGFWPLRVDLTPFARSLPGLHHLLPEYACLEGPGTLLTTVQAGLPHLDPDRVADALTLHAELDQAGAPTGYDLLPLVGSQQRTPTTGRVLDDRVQLSDLILGEDEAGDGAVPRLSATPRWLRPSDPSVRYATDKHGALPGKPQVLDDLQAILTADDVPRPGPELAPATALDVRVPEVAVAGASLPVEVKIRQGPVVELDAVLLLEDRMVLDRRRLVPDGDLLRVDLHPDLEGLCTVRVEPAEPSTLVPTVTSPLTLWAPTDGLAPRP